MFDSRPFLPLFASALIASTEAAASPVKVSQTAKAESILLDTLSFIEVRDLDFGTVVVPASGSGTLEVPADGSDPVFTDLGGSASATPLRGRLIGFGSPNIDVTVETTFPTAIYLDGDTSLGSIPISLILDKTADTVGSPSTWTYTSDGDGFYSIYVGGTLTVPSGTVAGNYQADFTITAYYP